MCCISSYAILPLRKHLMQKSMLERRSLDDNQYSYINSDLERDNSINNSLGSRQHKQRMIRPLEEAMEEFYTVEGGGREYGDGRGSGRARG